MRPDGFTLTQKNYSHSITPSNHGFFVSTSAGRPTTCEGEISSINLLSYDDVEKTEDTSLESVRVDRRL
ncbi:hypothetical protein FKM82_002139 [Ascaphus truei]